MDPTDCRLNDTPPEVALHQAKTDHHLWRTGYLTPVCYLGIVAYLIRRGHPKGLALRIASQTLDPPRRTVEAWALSRGRSHA